MKVHSIQKTQSGPLLGVKTGVPYGIWSPLCCPHLMELESSSIPGFLRIATLDPALTGPAHFSSPTSCTTFYIISD